MKTRYERKSTIKRMREEMEDKADQETAQNNNDAPGDDPLADQMDDEDPVIAQGLQDYENINQSSSIKTEAELEHFVSTLNSDQRRVYDIITSSLLHSIDHEENKCYCFDFKPLLLYCSGFGGTGKTYLIKVLVGFIYVQKYIFNRSCQTVLGAPTGLAADNIKGQPLHAAFNLLVEHGTHPKYMPFTKSALNQTQAVMKNMQCVIIDEVSMVSNVTLLLIHLRMCEIFGSMLPFGNKSVIIFGDLLQLPPVQAQPPFKEISDSLMNKVTGGTKVSLNLWREFQFDELTINQRQAGDENAAWKSLLYRVRTGTHNVGDIKVLNDRCIDIPGTLTSPDEILDNINKFYFQLSESGSDPVCLLPTREMVDRFNSAILGKLYPDAEEVVAVDHLDCKNKRSLKAAQQAVKSLDHLDDPRNTAGLEKSISVAAGVKVMLRCNIDVSQGLVNGAIGTITRFDRAPLTLTGRVTSIKVRFNNSPESHEIKAAR